MAYTGGRGLRRTRRSQSHNQDQNDDSSEDVRIDLLSAAESGAAAGRKMQTSLTTRPKTNALAAPVCLSVN